jgi:hypothetical protein
MAKALREPVKPHARPGRKSVTVYLPVNIWRELKVMAAMTDSTLDKLIRRGIDHVLAEHKNRRAP